MKKSRSYVLGVRVVNSKAALGRLCRVRKQRRRKLLSLPAFNFLFPLWKGSKVLLLALLLKRDRLTR